VTAPGNRTAISPGRGSGWQPTAPEVLPEQLAGWLAAAPGLVRVALDGPPSAAPERLAEALVAPLRALGRPAVHVRAATFWRDAALRFEHGREDVESYRVWLDADALRREVLDAATQGRYLPTLRDPDTNRSTREPARPLEEGSVVIVSGAFLLGRGLPFDRTVHLAQSAAARARRVAADKAWSLPAFVGYDEQVRPAERADVVIKLDDPRHPAIRWT
jgi:hypothetical protein